MPDPFSLASEPGIFEIATISVKQGCERIFESGVAEALPFFRRAKGFRSLKLERSVEERLRYRLVVEWDTIDDHTVHFRSSKDFEAWRSLVAHTFASAPVVEHTVVVLIDAGDEA